MYGPQGPERKGNKKKRMKRQARLNDDAAHHRLLTFAADAMLVSQSGEGRISRATWAEGYDDDDT